MLSGGDRLLALQSQVLHSLRKELDSTDFVIVGNQHEDGPKLNIDRYVEVSRVAREEGGFFQMAGMKFRGILGAIFPEWYGLQDGGLRASVLESEGFYTVESNGGAVLFVKEGEDGNITVAGKIYDVASFTSMVLDDHRWTPGSIYRRMIGNDHMPEIPFGTEKFVAQARYGGEFSAYTVTIGAAKEEKPDFQQFIDAFASRPEREIEELVHPLEDSFIFYSLEKLFTHAGSMNASDIRSLVRSGAKTDTLKNLPGILGMGVGLRLAPDGKAKAVVLRFHQGEGSVDNESLWVGRRHQYEPRTVVWEVSNSNPDYDLHRNLDSLNVLTSVVKAIFTFGLKHVCIPKSVYDEIRAKKDSGGDSTPGAEGRAPVDRVGEGEIPPVSFDAPAQSRRIAEGAVVNGIGVFSPVLPVQTLVAPGFGLGSGMVFGLMPVLV